MPIIPLIVDQHAEEAALLWLRRDYAVDQPHYTLQDLADLDNQIEAHLDGLRIAEADEFDAAWRVHLRELQWGDPSEVFPAGIMAWESGRPERIAHITTTGISSPENSRALISSLGWLPYECMATYAERLLGADCPALYRIAVAAVAIQRHDLGRHLGAAIDHADELLRARALRAAGELGSVDLVPQLREQLDECCDAVRGAAAWSLAMLTGETQAVEQLSRAVGSTGRESFRALQLTVRRMPVEVAQEWLNQLWRQPDMVDASVTADARPETLQRRIVVQGIGQLGLADNVPWLLEVMGDSVLSRIAGEAFTNITGRTLSDPAYEGEPPDGLEAGPNDDPEDEDIEIDPDENLLWPKQQALADWWVQHRQDFRPGVRYLCGQPITEPWCQQVLRYGSQRQRSAAALELAIMHPGGQPLFNVRARGDRQMKLLGL